MKLCTCLVGSYVRVQVASLVHLQIGGPCRPSPGATKYSREKPNGRDRPPCSGHRAMSVCERGCSALTCAGGEWLMLLWQTSVFPVSVGVRDQLILRPRNDDGLGFHP